MTFPYEVCMRGENGSFKAAHIIPTSNDVPSSIDISELRELLGNEIIDLMAQNSILISRIEELENELEKYIKANGGSLS